MTARSKVDQLSNALCIRKMNHGRWKSFLLHGPDGVNLVCEHEKLSTVLHMLSTKVRLLEDKEAHTCRCVNSGLSPEETAKLCRCTLFPAMDQL